MRNKLFRSLALMAIVAITSACSTKEIPAEVFEAGNGPYISEVGENLYFVEDFNNGGNICFLVAKKGVLIVDAGNFPGPVEKVMAIIRKVTDKPLTHLVYTHVHGDHVGGAAGFPGDISIVAHENLNPNLEKFFSPGLEAFESRVEELGEDSLRLVYGERFDDIAGVEVRPANKTFAEEMTVDMGSYTVELYYPGTCHTSDNIYVLFKEQKVLHTGDLVFNRRHPFIGAAYEANPWLWAETVKEWAGKDLVKVIPGHGPVGGPEILAEQSAYVDTLIEASGTHKHTQMAISESAQELHNEYFPDFQIGGFFTGGEQLIIDKLGE